MPMVLKMCLLALAKHKKLGTLSFRGFSTFSTMMNETVTLLRNGKIACFIGYALASIVVPVMAVACGYWLA